MKKQALFPLPEQPGYYGYVGEQGEQQKVDDAEFWATEAVEMLTERIAKMQLKRDS